MPEWGEKKRGRSLEQYGLIPECINRWRLNIVLVVRILLQM